MDKQMKELYKLPKLESRKNNRFYWGVLAVIASTVLIMVILLTIGSYNRVLNNCMNEGYTREYCEMMLN